MAKKKIAIGGITRNTSVHNSVDGTMDELVGWRCLDGNLRPAQEYEDTGLQLGLHEKLMYVHKYGDYCHYVIYKSGIDGNSLMVYSSIGREEDSVVLSTDIEEVLGVTSIGNILIVSTATGLKEYIYKSGSYGEFKRANLPLLEIRQKKESEIHSASTDVPAAVSPDKWYGEFELPSSGSQVNNFGDINFALENGSTFEWKRNNVKDEAYKKNWFVDGMYVRYGLRLYDGNYIYVSPPVLVKQIGDYVYQGYADYHRLDVDGDGYNDAYGIQYFRDSVVYSDTYSLSLVCTEAGSVDSDVYPAVDIFVSLPIDRYAGVDRISQTETFLSPDGGTTWDKEKGWYYTKWNVAKYRKPINPEENINYYKVAEIKTAELAVGYVKKMEVGDQMSYIEQLPALDYNTRPHEYYPGGMSVYNNRLHIYRLNERLFGGWILPYYTYTKTEDGTTSGTAINRAVSVVYLSDAAENYSAKAVHGEGESYLTLSELLSYPDGRATRLVIAWEDKPGLNRYKIDVLLTEHPFQDIAYYYKEGATIESMREMLSLAEFEELYNMATDNVIYRPNVMKVSELNNPSVFPVDTTYTIGSGTITATAVATKAISQGQFGQYPLYVFTSDGVYTMQTGLGDTVYSNMAPVSRHVCKNIDTICPIDDAVVFGTEQGLFVMQGGDAVNISVPIDEHGIINTEEHSLRAQSVAVTGKSYVRHTLRTLIREGKTAFHYKGGEILLYIPDSGIVYAYSITNRLWQSYSLKLSYTVERYPDLLLVSDMSLIPVEPLDASGTGQRVMELADEDASEVADEMLLVTQPMQLDSSLYYKGSVRLHILSYLAGGDDCMAKIGLLGSNDGIEYSIVWQREMMVKRLFNPVISLPGASYRFYSLVLYCNNVYKQSYINGFEIEYDNRFEEK